MTRPPSSEPAGFDRRKWSGPASADAPTSACLDEDTLGALAEGALDEAMRAAVLPHLAECARCRATVASVARALADPGLAGAIEAVASRSRRWRWLAAGAVAAAVALVLLVPTGTFRESSPGPHRSPAGDAAPVTLAPAGEVAGVKEFRWAPVPAADRYRLTLFTPSGGVLFEATGTDAFVLLPDSLMLSPGIRYFWRVDARVGFGRWTSSGLVGFTLVEAARP